MAKSDKKKREQAKTSTDEHDDDIVEQKKSEDEQGSDEELEGSTEAEDQESEDEAVVPDDDDESDDDESDDDESDDDESDDDDDDDDESDDDDDDDDDESDDDEEAPKVKPQKKAAQAAMSSKAGAAKQDKAAKQGAATSKKAKSEGKPKARAKGGDDTDVEPVAAKKPKAAKKPGDLLSEDIPDLFGFERPEEIADYYPSDAGSGIPMGALIGLIVVIAALAGGGYYAKTVLSQRQADIEAGEAQARLDAEAAKVPEVRYGNLALLASTPPKALILQNGEPIYAKTSSGAVTELRAGPSTRVQNIKIEPGATVKFTLVSEGYKPYELELGEYDWVPIPATGDWEKVFHNVRLEPEDRPFLSNCEAVQAVGPAFQSACRVSVSDEIATRKDFERLYEAQLTGEMTIKSNPEGAKIFYMTKPLLKEDGQQAVTPYTFNVYGKDDKGVDKKPRVTEDLSVRLELEGYDAYLGNVYPHQWHCATAVNPEELKKAVLPAKFEATGPDLLHHLCTYSATVSGTLKKPEAEAPVEDPGAGTP